MYAFIEGQVCEKAGGQLVLLAGGVGYQLNCSMTTLQAAPVTGETMRCYTYLAVREDAMELYGFATKEEKSLFLSLIGISGVGAKMALALLGSMPIRDLSLAILLGDVNALSRAPGIGKKTAQRMILELKGKLASTALPPAEGLFSPPEEDKEALGKVIEDLLALGFAPAEAELACKGMPQGLDEGRALQYALKKIGGA